MQLFHNSNNAKRAHNDSFKKNRFGLAGHIIQVIWMGTKQVSTSTCKHFLRFCKWKDNVGEPKIKKIIPVSRVTRDYGFESVARER